MYSYTSILRYTFTVSSAAHETATRYGAWCVSQSDLRFLGSRTSLGGYTHDHTHVTQVDDPYGA